jgi:hypothetical protein
MNRRSISYEEIALSSMLTLNALVELSDERGILKREEILDHAKKLRADIKALPRTH